MNWFQLKKMMDYLIFISLVCVASSFLFTGTVRAAGISYTDQKLTNNACELFAKDAYQAAENYARGVELEQLLNLIESTPDSMVPASQKERIFQAIQLVYGRQIDNPIAASQIAMGVCLPARSELAPLENIYIGINPKLQKYYF